MEYLPPLRQDIDIIPFRHEGRSLLLIRDSLGLISPGLALGAEVSPFLPFFDGMTTPEDFRLALVRQSGGNLVTTEEVLALAEKLDGLGLLQTKRYRREREKMVAQFAALRERPAALAGSAYSSQPEVLAEEIDGLLKVDLDAECAGKNSPCAVAAPHIDLKVSGKAYGRAYAPLAGAAPEAVLLLGTGHSLEHLFSLTDKTFVTPLGKVAADAEAVARLRAAGGASVAPDDFAHRSEHSLEFQLLFLQRLFPMEEVPVIPLLCGSLEPFLLLGKKPGEDSSVASFVRQLGEWLADSRSRRIAVAGVDLSHVGPKFGDGDPARELEAHFRVSDGRVLDALEKGDADTLYETIAREGNQFNVCGFSALWTLLAALPGLKGKVLDYTVWHEEATRSAVSFAAVSFTRRR
jgi:AmmeMemoRadiSam system protein B